MDSIQFRDRFRISDLCCKGREVEIAKGLALGADAYFTKPFSNAALVAKVKELLEKTDENKSGINSGNL